MAALTASESWWDRRWLAGVLPPLFVVVKAGRLVWWDFGETAEVLRHLGAETVIMLTLLGLLPLVFGAATGVLWAGSLKEIRRREGVLPAALSAAALLVLVAPAYLVVAMGLMLLAERLFGRLRRGGDGRGEGGGIAGDVAVLVVLLFWAALLPRGLPLQELRLRDGGEGRTLIAVVLNIDDREVHYVDRAGQRVSSLPRSRVISRVRCRERADFGSPTLLNLVTGRSRSVAPCPEP